MRYRGKVQQTDCEWADFLKLPIVDISSLYQDDPAARLEAADRLGRVAHEIGFLYISGYRIDQRVFDASFEAARQFFSRPLDLKNRYYIGNSPNHRGYVPTTERGDYADEGGRRYEAFDLALDLPPGDPDFLAGNCLLGPNQWPDLAGFRCAINRYFNEMLELGYLLMAAFEMHLGVPDGWFRSRMSKPISQLRLIHYLENDAAKEAGNNMGAHTDYECFTILRQFSPGLQVLNLADRWIDVAPIPDTFVINIGDMLETWTGGYFRSTLHRVINNGEERYSMPFFMAANFDAIIEPIPGYESDCERHRPFMAGEHLKRMLIRDFPYLRRRFADSSCGYTTGSFVDYNPFEMRLVSDVDSGGA